MEYSLNINWAISKIRIWKEVENVYMAESWENIRDYSISTVENQHDV